MINSEKMAQQAKKNQILVLKGPQGSGKTVLAKKIANTHGAFKLINEPITRNGINYHLRKEYACLIFDEFFYEKETVDYLKEIVLSETIKTGKNRKEYKTPWVIVCTNGRFPESKLAHIVPVERYMPVMTPPRQLPFAGTYDGAELKPLPGLTADRFAAFALPSRIGNSLHYPDGRVEKFPSFLGNA